MTPVSVIRSQKMKKAEFVLGVDQEGASPRSASQQQEPRTRIQPTPLIELLRLQEQALRRVLMPSVPRSPLSGARK